MSEVDKVTFTSAKFGEMTIDQTSVLTFPNGLPGFERLTRYGLLTIEEEAPFLRLLSIKEPAVGFVLLNPMLIWEDYNPRISADDLEGLEIEGPDEMAMYCIVTLSPVPQEVTANLKGPITVNTRTMTARQMILTDDSYHTKHSLLAASEQVAQSP